MARGFGASYLAESSENSNHEAQTKSYFPFRLLILSVPRGQRRNTNEKVLIFTTLFVLVLGTLPASAITWGLLDGDTHPNVGAIVLTLEDSTLLPICSGTLIHRSVFLTAGHCTDFVEFYLDSGMATDVHVTFDQDLIAPTLLDVDKVITHPDYNTKVLSNPHDVGVLVLVEPEDSIPPANWPDERFLNDLRNAGELRQGKEEADFTVVGYGGTLSWPPPEVTYEDARQYAESEYLALRKAWLLLSQNKATGDGGTCYGDSGGPVFWYENGYEILVGITSWGDSPCVATGFYYRVDIPETLDFIQEVIDGLQ